MLYVIVWKIWLRRKRRAGIAQRKRKQQALIRQDGPRTRGTATIPRGSARTNALSRVADGGGIGEVERDARRDDG